WVLQGAHERAELILEVRAAALAQDPSEGSVASSRQRAPQLGQSLDRRDRARGQAGGGADTKGALFEVEDRDFPVAVDELGARFDFEGPALEGLAPGSELLLRLGDEPRDALLAVLALGPARQERVQGRGVSCA